MDSWIVKIQNCSSLLIPLEKNTSMPPNGSCHVFFHLGFMKVFVMAMQSLQNRILHHTKQSSNVQLQILMRHVSIDTGKSCIQMDSRIISLLLLPLDSITDESYRLTEIPMAVPNLAPCSSIVILSLHYLSHFWHFFV